MIGIGLRECRENSVVGISVKGQNGHSKLHVEFYNYVEYKEVK